jgi:diguanylate cyclase (GGDEF)-like protein
MSKLSIDTVSLVFVLAAVNLISALFALVYSRLARSTLRLGLFVLAKSGQGLSWLLRIYCLTTPNPILETVTNVCLLLGTTFELLMLADFARPGLRRHRVVLGILGATVGLAGSLAIKAAPLAGSVLLLSAYAAMALYAPLVLFASAGASRFQRFLAAFYILLQLGVGTLYVALGAEVAGVGASSDWKAPIYYSLLMALQLVGSLGYLLMSSERDSATLHEQATHDALTGSLNRRAFFEMAAPLIANANRSGQEVAAIVADLDRFKQVNDRWGHGAGDRMLQAFATAVGRAVRQGDISARFGGDEFVILLPDCDRPSALAVAERLLAELRDLRLPVGKDELRCTASLGISTGRPIGEEELSALLAAADEALYEAKTRGRDQAESPARDRILTDTEGSLQSTPSASRSRT